MVTLYVRWITSGKINTATGEVWKVEDVPERWKDEVRERIEN